jgi:two-component system sensor histidine kinase KdpD
VLRASRADWPDIARSTLAIVLALGVASAIVGAVESVFGVSNASAIYLLAVVVVAIRYGATLAIVTSIGAFAAYNFLFVDPRFTLSVARAEELLTLFLLLVVGLVMSRIAGLQRSREQEARRREREARALFGISRELATSHRLTDALQTVVERVAADAGMARTWVGLGATAAAERVVADSRRGGQTPPTAPSHSVLRRDREEGAATWTRISTAAKTSAPRADHARTRTALFRVELRAADETIGSLWSERAESSGPPALEETRLLAAAADQIGQAVRRDRLQTQAAELEIARRSDELKSALVDSVSHDLRTPLTTIRAAAGSLVDPVVQMSDDDRRATARAIDEEAERLSNLVGDLLDMSRIQSGALVAEVVELPLETVVSPAVERARASAKDRVIETELRPDLPHVLADEALLDRVITNLLDNALKYAGDGTRIVVRGVANPDGTVSLVVEDAGPGVPEAALPQLFDRFYRVPEANPGPRRGMGLGLAVVKGLLEAMSGTVSAGRSSLGGLAVTIGLPAADGSHG